MTSESTTDRETTSGFLDRVEELLAEGIDEADGDWERAQELLCERYPEHAEAIRWRIGYVREGSGVQPEQLVGGAGSSFPERLGDFRLLRRLGGGGMGVVYLAEQESLGREVALKLVRPEHLYFEGSKARFRREVEAIARLQHEGIVPVHLVGEESGVPFLAMERVEGCTLAEVLEELKDRDPAGLSGSNFRDAILNRLGRPRDDSADLEGTIFSGSWVEVCFRVARQVAEALAHAHLHGILHRDVKPSNVMVTPRGRAMLLDFGLAHVEGGHRITLSGSTIGSLPYLSPEQVAEGKGEPSARMDVYALGVTLYELLTLHPPYRNESGEGVRQLILRGQPEPPGRRNRAVPWDAETVCLKAMEKSAARRYSTAGDFAQDLGNVLALRPIAARRPGPVLRARRWARRHRAWTAAIGVGVVLLVSGTVLQVLREQAAAEQIRIRQDALLVKALLAEADDAWPVSPDEITRTDRWLSQAEPLHARLPAYRSRLLALEGGAEPRTEADRERDTRLRAAAERELADERVRLAGFQSRAAMRVHLPRPQYEHLLEEIEAALKMAERGVLERYTWRFADPDQGALHETLRELLPDLVSLGESLHAIKERRKSLLSVEERSVEWDGTIRALADPSAHPVYGGLRIPPQRGLLPLGPDPDSGLFEFAHSMTGKVPLRSPRTGRLELTAETGMVFVLIPGGHLHTASGPGPRTVPLEPFFLSKYEMTQGQWHRTTGRNPSHIRAGWTIEGREITGLHPVEWVSWVECDALLGRLGLCLPTRDQWEYAARGGDSGNWWLPSDWLSLEGAGNLADLSVMQAGEAYGRRYGGVSGLLWDDGYVLHAPVGRFRPNGYGLHDLVGNVSEWCGDRAQLGEGLAYRIQCGTGFECNPNYGWYVATRERARTVALGVRPARELER